MAGGSLDDAKKNKNDEFYTSGSDIEKELGNYTEHFKNKIVYCNCDDPEESEFFKYFIDCFKLFKLKKLICTCYFDSPVNNNKDLFNGYKIVVSKKDVEKYEIITKETIKEIVKKCRTQIFGDEKYKPGDFRSTECVELLKQADIVVTNPPFSLFREYVAQLIEYNKKFVIVGNQNAISYKEIFPLIKNNLVWLGYKSGDMAFRVPAYSEPRQTRFWIDETGQKWRSLGNACWFTNLDIKKRHEELDLYKKYNPQEYPKYDNYDAINVDKTADIPCDYYEPMGVPITFLDKYSPEQFEILELGIVGSCNFSCNKKMEILDKFGNATGKFTMNAKGTLYRKWDKNIDKKPPAFKDCETGDLYQSIYARILIKRIKNEN